MATYDSLSVEQKAVLAAWEKNTRAWLGSAIGKATSEARSLQAAASASGGAYDILDSLDAGEVVPNSSALAGAQSLTKEEWNTMRTAGLEDFLASYDTLPVRKVIAKAAGPKSGLS